MFEALWSILFAFSLQFFTNVKSQGLRPYKNRIQAGFGQEPIVYYSLA